MVGPVGASVLMACRCEAKTLAEKAPVSLRRFNEASVYRQRSQQVFDLSIDPHHANELGARPCGRTWTELLRG